MWHDERRYYDFKLARGVYAPMTPVEVARLRARRAARQRAVAAGCSPRTAQEIEAVLAALDRRDQPNAPSLASVWMLLAISLAAFVAAGIWQWDRTFVALIVVALLFHEGGHYAAMRAFGYRNLRLFFLPLFGAAVSGHNPRAAGWQKAVVSLAGPLPGLLLGAGMWLAGRRQDGGDSLAWKVALVLIALNASNLLPFLPLDGGRLLYETLCVRRAWLRTGFSALGGVGVLALAYRFDSPILGLLGCFLLTRVGRMQRVNRAVRELRAGGVALLDPAPPPGQERAVRPDALPTLLAALKRGRAKPPAANTLVSETLAVIDLERARPARCGRHARSGGPLRGSLRPLVVPALAAFIGGQLALSAARTCGNCPALPSLVFLCAMNFAYSSMNVMPGGRKSKSDGLSRKNSR